VFDSCSSLTSAAIGNGGIIIGDAAFEDCTNLTSVTIPGSVTSIGINAFELCASLTSVTIPNSVRSIGLDAFAQCGDLKSVYFGGNAPIADPNAFYLDNATAYYLPGTTGWDANFYGLPTALWTLPYPLILTGSSAAGVQSSGFSFNVSWATNLSVVVEACTNLANPVWSAVATNTLTGGTSHFSDAQSSNYPARFYRLRSP